MQIGIQIQLDGEHFPSDVDLNIRDVLEAALDTQPGMVVTGLGSGMGVLDIVVAVKRRQPALRFIHQLIDRYHLSTVTTITVEERIKAAIHVRAGDLFGVPIAPHAWSIGLVLHKSTTFRGCIMVGFFDMLVSAPDQVAIKTLPTSFIAPPNYTGIDAIASGSWPRIGRSETHLNAATIPELLVSYTLYLKDTPIRHVSIDEIKQYASLSVAGVGFVVNQLQHSFADRLAAMEPKER